MSTAVSQPTVWPPDLLEYARRHGVEHVLEPLLEATRQVFPTARDVRVYLEPDVALPDLWFIVYEVRLPRMSAQDFIAADRQWGREEMRLYPPPTRVAFSLRVNWDKA